MLFFFTRNKTPVKLSSQQRNKYKAFFQTISWIPMQKKGKEKLLIVFSFFLRAANFRGVFSDSFWVYRWKKLAVQPIDLLSIFLITYWGHMEFLGGKKTKRVYSIRIPLLLCLGQRARLNFRKERPKYSNLKMIYCVLHHFILKGLNADEYCAWRPTFFWSPRLLLWIFKTYKAMWWFWFTSEIAKINCIVRHLFKIVWQWIMQF